MLAASLGVLSVAAMPASAAPLCKCELADGPFKTWILLDNQTVALFDSRTGEIVTEVALASGCNSIVTNPGCSTVFVGTVGDEAAGIPPGICDIDCETFEIIDRPLPAAPIPNGLLCIGDLVVVAMADGTVGFLDTATGKLRIVQVAGGCNSILSKCDGSTIFVGTVGDPATGKAPGFCDIDSKTLEVIERPLPAPPVPNGFWLSPDDRFLWIMLQDFSVVVFDCLDGVLLAQVPVAGGCNSIKGKCDGSRVFVGTVGGDVPQVFFPPVGFGQGGPGASEMGVVGGGENFLIDSFFDITYDIIIDVPSGPFAGTHELTGPNALRGNVQVRRDDPVRRFEQPGVPATFQTEMLSMELVSLQLDPGHVTILKGPGDPGPGIVVGGNSVFVGDFPALAVDSFFDITYQIDFVSLDGTGASFFPPDPIRHELDLDGPPLTQIPFADVWWRVPETNPEGIVLFQRPENFNPDFPEQIFIRCERICFPPPPPPKAPGVCDIPFGSFIPFECDLPAPPIPCGITIDVLTQNIWVAMQNGTVGVWDCDWNPLAPDIQVGGGCTAIEFNPDMSAVFVGTAGNPLLNKPPGICDIDPITFLVSEAPMPGIPLPKGIEICPLGAALPCLGDCDGNGIVDFNDLVSMLFVFGQNTGDECDADGNGIVNFNDLVSTLFLFGPCP